MNLKAAHNSVIFNSRILAVDRGILLSVLGIQNILVLAPVHNCEKRFKL